MCLCFPKVNPDERSLDSPIDRSSINTPQISKRRQLSHSREGMMDAANQLKEQRQKCEDEFDAFGKCCE